jgi:hypothetical protein
MRSAGVVGRGGLCVRAFLASEPVRILIPGESNVGMGVDGLANPRF